MIVGRNNVQESIEKRGEGLELRQGAGCQDFLTPKDGFNCRADICDEIRH